MRADKPMTRPDVVAALRAMVSGAQKARSEIVESSPRATPEDLARAHPWLFSMRSGRPAGVMPTLVQAVEDAEAGKPITGTEFMNLVLIATRLEASIVICSVNMHGDVIPDFDRAIELAGQTW